jgi:hypothetical protein
MHKKLESELISIAHSILQMKNKKDVVALKNKARDVYERLAVLEFVDRFVTTSPTNELSKEEILDKISNEKNLVEEPLADRTTDIAVAPIVEKKEAEQIPNVTEVAEVLLEEESKDSKGIHHKKGAEEKEPKEDKKEVTKEVVISETPNLFSGAASETETKKSTLEEELKDTIPVDVATDIFENAVRVETPKKSLNETLVQKNIQIGLNDRIAFVKHLFEGSQEDFNRVMSQLNSFKEEKEAKRFLNKMVKSDYDWSGKEEYEERFLNLLERKFS